jgi:hypothetical protein
MVMIKCPVCNGRGKLASPSRVPDTALRQEAAVTLVGRAAFLTAKPCGCLAISPRAVLCRR